MRKYLITASLLFGSFPAFAEFESIVIDASPGSGVCVVVPKILGEFRPLPAIERFPIQAEPHEYTVAGTLSRYGDKIPKTEDGRHVFLVGRTSTGEVLVSTALRFPNRRAAHGGEYMVTHRSLERNFPPGTEFIAAGEYLSRNGKVNEITNKAGTYRTGPEQLGFSRRALVAGGLDVSENTRLYDFSAENTRDREHAQAHRIVKLELYFAHNPTLNEARIISERILKKLYQKFPGDQKSYGKADISPVLPKYDAIEEQLSPTERKRLDTILTVLMSEGQQEGPEFAIAHMKFKPNLMDLAESNAPLPEDEAKHIKEKFEHLEKAVDLLVK